MKKSFLFLVLCLPALLAGSLQAADSGTDSESQNLAVDFSKSAVNKFESVESSAVNISVYNADIQNYADGVAKTLLDGGVSVSEAGQIMEKMSGFYADALVGFSRRKNMNVTIQAYTGSVADLLSGEKLDIAVQSPIISASSEHLEKMNSLLHEYQRY